MTEGELKKHVNELHFMLHVTSEHDIRQIREVFKSIIDEAKNDIENESCFEAYSYSLTESEESIIIPLRIWKKWFGDST